MPEVGGLASSTLVAGDLSIFPGVDGNGGETEEPPDEVATSEPDLPSLPPLPKLEEGLLQQPKLFSDAVKLRFAAGNVLTLVSAADKMVLYRGAERWLLKVRSGDDEQLLSWRANDSARNAMRNAKAGCVLLIDSLLQKDSELNATLVFPHEWWKTIGPYEKLSVLSHQMADPPECLVIAAVATVPNKRKDGQNRIVKMEDGKVYRFGRPQDVNGSGSRRALVLTPGATLDLDAWCSR